LCLVHDASCVVDIEAARECPRTQAKHVRGSAGCVRPSPQSLRAQTGSVRDACYTVRVLLPALMLASLLGSPDGEAIAAAHTEHAAEQARQAREPATRAARKLLGLVDTIDRTLVEGAYQHNTRVRRREGVYRWDCSGMMTWMLERVAPRAREALDRDRPVARTYYRTIARASSKRARDGWRRVPDIAEVRPGDIFAWLRPPDWPKGGNTGHVGIVIEPPRPAPEIENAWEVRVVDASRYTHDDDTRDPDGEGGFGMGTIVFVTDETGAPTAYGWFGSRSRYVHETSIAFGRVSR
jgi:hypothetical protein